jgi:hypothetical protein
MLAAIPSLPVDQPKEGALLTVIIITIIFVTTMLTCERVEGPLSGFSSTMDRFVSRLSANHRRGERSVSQSQEGGEKCQPITGGAREVTANRRS